MDVVGRITVVDAHGKLRDAAPVWQGEAVNVAAATVDGVWRYLGRTADPFTRRLRLFVPEKGLFSTGQVMVDPLLARVTRPRSP
jgi:hypothetical protein